MRFENLTLKPRKIAHFALSGDEYPMMDGVKMPSCAFLNPGTAKQAGANAFLR